MGIGTLTPKFPLAFADAVGEKIALWGGSTSSTSVHFGMGIQSSLMQFYTDAATSDIGFGYGNSSVFTENMRIRGDGNISVGGPVWASAANNRTIRFGDGDFVHIGEVGADDKMELKASSFVFKTGKVQIQDGSEGAGKAFVSDANGVGTWSPQAFTNVERFKVTGNGQNGGAGFVADFTNTIYNYSSNIVINLAAESITFNKAGLYHLEFSAKSSFTTTPINTGNTGYLVINGVSEFVDYVPVVPANGNYTCAALKFSVDRYMPAGTVLKIRIDAPVLGILDNYLAGYLIAE